MSDESFQSLPPNGRLISTGLAAAGALGLLINHVMIDSLGMGKLMILGLAPIALFLGLGGIVEPKIVWSVGKYGKHLPVIYKLIGGALGAAGVAVTLLLLLFVYRLGPPEPAPSSRLPDPASRSNKHAATAAASPSKARPAEKTNSSQAAKAANPQRRVMPQEVQQLTYDRPNKRWVQMDEEAMQGVGREDADGLTTLHYAEGEHALLKVLWPDVLEIGDRFTVELRGANSIEMVDLEGADANVRTSLPASDKFVAVEIRLEQDKVTIFCDGQSQNPYYASGKLRGDEAKAALLAAALQPAFSVKKGSQASFRNAQILKP